MVDKLFRFFEDCGRMGSLEGIFIASQEEVDAAVGKTVCFGDVLGKHSDVTLELQASNFDLITGDQEFIKKFMDLGCTSGLNPLYHVEENE